MTVRELARIFAVAATAMALAACVQNHHKLQETLARPADRPTTILVLPADVQLAEVSFGGLPTPREDWTAAAREHMNTALRAALGAREVDVVFHDGQVDDEETAKILRLHAAVGHTIRVHKYVQQANLPTKTDKFDWTLGEPVRVLADKHKADYVLFVHMRDYYSSAARVAAQVIAAAVFRVGISGGGQVGFASLVDLRTGDVVWFNRLLRGVGDLRTEEPARETVAALLEGMPK